MRNFFRGVHKTVGNKFWTAVGGPENGSSKVKYTDVFYKSLYPDQLLSVINAPVAHLDRASAFDIEQELLCSK